MNSAMAVPIVTVIPSTKSSPLPDGREGVVLANPVHRMAKKTLLLVCLTAERFHEARSA
jgi:hypothetical protein